VLVSVDGAEVWLQGPLPLASVANLTIAAGIYQSLVCRAMDNLGRYGSAHVVASRQQRLAVGLGYMILVRQSRVAIRSMSDVWLDGFPNMC
jgi:hypothetical protein